jgi:Flp pilus assembly protein TadD
VDGPVGFWNGPAAAAWSNWPAALAVAAFTFLAFLPALENHFVNFDDYDLLVYNRAYRGLDPANLTWIFGAFHMGHYMPLTWVSYGLDYVVWGMDPFGYHLTNLIIHAANAALFFLIGVRLLAVAMPALRTELLGLRLAALTAALLFALHPLRVESVAWATERRDVLCAFFYLLAILAYLHACDGRARGERVARLWYGAAIAAHAAALLSKSMAVSLPVVLLLLDIYPLRRLTVDSGVLRTTDRRRVLTEKVPFFLLSTVGGLVAIAAIRHIDNLTPLNRLGILERLSITAYSLAFYMWKMLVPLNLSPLYEIPESIRWWDPAFALSSLVVLTVTVIAVRFRHRWPALAAVWASYIVILLPVSGIAQNGPQIAADRYTYLSGLGWALLSGAGLGAAWLAIRRRQPVSSAARRLLPLVLVSSVGLGVLTWRQAEVWHDTEALWTHALAASPSAKAHEALGILLAERGRAADALAHYEESLRIKPSYGPGHVALGVALSEQGRVPEAISHYEEAARLMPRSAIPYNNLGTALAAQGRTVEAIEQYREAVTRSPGDADIHNNLGRALAQLGRLPEAIEQYREGLRLRPDHAGMHTNLGIALAGEERTAEALQHFRDAVVLQPGNAEARNNLGLILVKAGRAEEAEAQFREALSLKPDLRDAQNNLERLMSLRGKGPR